MVNLEKINYLIVEKGLKRKEIANYFNWSASCVARKLNGERQIKTNELFKMAKLLDVDIKELYKEDV